MDRRESEAMDCRQPATDIRSDRVCVIFLGESPDDKVEYNICFVDVNDDFGGDVISIRPNIKIDGGSYIRKNMDALCVVGETLYLFEGCGKDGCVAVAEDCRDSFYRLDLSSVGSKSNAKFPLKLKKKKKRPITKLGKADLHKVGKMAHRKSSPVAIPTPDGQKIVIFSSVPCSRCAGRSECGTFDLYHLSDREWKNLPSLAHYIREVSAPCRPFMHIERYGFIRASVLMVVVYMAGMFVLDLEYLDKGWEKFGRGYFESPCGGPLFVGVDDWFCLTTSGVYDLGVKEDGFTGFSFFPLTPFQRPPPFDKFVGDGFPPPPPTFNNYITLLSHDKVKGIVTFCVLQTIMEYGVNPKRADLNFQICEAELGKYKQFGQAKVTTQVVKAPKFSFCLEQMDYISPLYFCSIPC